MHAGGKNPGGKESREDKMKGVKLAGWKIREEKLPGGKNSGESWGPAKLYNIYIYLRAFKSIERENHSHFSYSFHS